MIPATAGSAKTTGGKISRVELVGPTGTPVNVVNGGIATEQLPPATPLQYQAQVFGGTTTNVLTSIPQSTQLSISSITVTCVSCTGEDSTYITLFSGNGPDCTTAYLTQTDLAEVGTTSDSPSVDFTYPTPLGAPDFSPTGAWCLGIYVSGASFPAFVSIEGSQ